MFSEALLDHFRNPHHVGELAPPATVVEVSNPACGDILRLSASFDGERITEARYLVRGCTASIAAGSALTDLITGRTRSQAAALSTADIEQQLGGLPAASRHAASLCLDGLRALLRK